VVVEALAWQSRPYQTAADLRLMQTLSSACWRADWPAPLGHPGDLDWWSRDEVPGSLPLSERAQLWFAGEVDASDLVAWAWFNLPSDFELMIRPDMRVAGLVRAIVDWAGRRAVTVVDDGVPVEAVQAFATDAQPDVVGALRGLGFEAVEDHLLAHLTRRFEGWPIAAAGLPAGFELRLLGTEADVASRVACGRAAFPSSRMTVEKYDVARRSTLYRPALDWLVIAPDGAVAGFALGWLDPVTLGLELEPVGIHPAYQRRGLGRAVCLATIAAARTLGASHGLICAEGGNEAALRLYRSLGYEITTWTRPYRRPLRD
jgi:ribosomal protein S18 acetylase RimI-like enzyme